MGLSDREYYRDDQPGGYQLGGERMMVVNLMIANVAVYVLCMFIQNLTTTLSLRADLFASPGNLVQLWQLVTYGFVHAPIDDGGRSIFHILMNMYLLWMFGREVEMKYGRYEFLRLYLVAIVLSGLAWVLRQTLIGGSGSVLGASGAVTAVVILFCLNWPKRQIYLFGLMAIPAWGLGLIFIGLDVLQSFRPESRVAWDCHLAGALFAFGYYRLGVNFGSLMPSGGKRKWLERKPNLRVHAPDDSYSDLDEEADRVLAKLHHEGEESLNARERKVLEAYSRRMRQKHR